MMISSTFAPPARAWKVASDARRISSRAIEAPPTSSPSYSSSIFPVIAGSAA
jgi:hypothetical protein